MVYNIRFVVMLPIPGTATAPASPGEPYECMTSVRADTAAGAIILSGLVEKPGLIRITSVIGCAMPTEMPT